MKRLALMFVAILLTGLLCQTAESRGYRHGGWHGGYGVYRGYYGYRNYPYWGIIGGAYYSPYGFAPYGYPPYGYNPYWYAPAPPLNVRIF